MVVVSNNSCYVFVQFIFPVVSNDTISVLNCEYHLNVDLSIGICHGKYLVLL